MFVFFVGTALTVVTRVNSQWYTVHLPGAEIVCGGGGQNILPLQDA